VVYAGSEESSVYALNASTGSLLWSYPGDIEYSSPAVANGVVYLGFFNDDTVYAFGLSGGDLAERESAKRPDLRTLRPSSNP
jgi:outer membrane protein assembly factor BamB